MKNQLRSSSSSALRRRRRRKIEEKTKPSPCNNESFLPDDVIIDILSRLPLKDVFRSQCVCRRWSDLTSTKDFTDLHGRRFPNPPMILKDYNGMDLLDICWGTAQTKTKIHKLKYHNHSDPYFSHNGLIVAYKGMDYAFPEACIIIYNPIYRDVVKIILPESPFGSVYGIFFHPVLKEYCTLWRITLSYEPLKVQYKILNLESNPQWRDLKNPCTQNARILRIPPLLIGEYLYWMVDPFEPYTDTDTLSYNIMEYDIRNEEFRVIPCPVDCNKIHRNVNLVDVDGVVSLVKVFPYIKVWTLKNHGEQLWTSFHFKASSYICDEFALDKAIAFWNGELVLQSFGRLYAYNLKLGTYRRFGKDYERDVQFFPHLTSLVSLRNCMSTICMLEEAEDNLRKICRGDEILARRYMFI